MCIFHLITTIDEEMQSNTQNIRIPTLLKSDTNFSASLMARTKKNI